MPFLFLGAFKVKENSFKISCIASLIFNMDNAVVRDISSLGTLGAYAPSEFWIPIRGKEKRDWMEEKNSAPIEINADPATCYRKYVCF